jgi:hypothetical protein
MGMKMLILGIVTAVFGWVVLLGAGAGGIVNFHATAIGGHAIELGYLLVLVAVIRDRLKA